MSRYHHELGVSRVCILKGGGGDGVEVWTNGFGLIQVVPATARKVLDTGMLNVEIGARPIARQTFYA